MKSSEEVGIGLEIANSAASAISALAFFLMSWRKMGGGGGEKEEEEEEEETGIVIEHHAPATHLDLFRGHQAVFKSKFLCKLVRVTSYTYILNLFCSSIAANKEGQRDGERGRE